AGTPAPPSTTDRRRAIPHARARPVNGSPVSAFRRHELPRPPRAARLVVPRHEQRARFRDARPRRDLHDLVDRSRAGARTHLAQPLPQPNAQLAACSRQELELLAVVLRQLDELEAKLDHRGRELRELRPERSLDAVELGGWISQRRAAPPRTATDEPSREGELPHEARSTFRPGHQRLDERTECTPQCELVADRLRKLERLDDLCRRAAPAGPRRLAAPPPAPGAPAVPP